MLAKGEDPCLYTKSAKLIYMREREALRGFRPIATKRLGITINLGAIGRFYGTETVIRL